MREICKSGSEGGGTETNRSFLPLCANAQQGGSRRDPHSRFATLRFQQRLNEAAPCDRRVGIGCEPDLRIAERGDVPRDLLPEAELESRALRYAATENDRQRVGEPLAKGRQQSFDSQNNFR